MKVNKTYILAAVFVVLAVLAYFITTDRGEKTATYKLEKQLFEVDSALIDKLEIEQNGKKVTLVKSGVEWRLSQPVDYSAYPQFVAAALSDLKKYKLESKVSDNPSNKDRFGFNDTNLVKVTVYQGQNLMGTMIIGHAANGPSQTFIKSPESNEIFLANDFLRSNFAKESIYDDWRDKLILSISKASITSIDFISQSEKYSITRDSAGTYRSGKDSLNTQVVDGVFSMLQNFNTQGFKDTTISDDTKFDYTVKVNADKVYLINFLKIGEGPNPKFLLKVSDKKQIFVVDENFLKLLFKNRKELVVS